MFNRRMIITLITGAGLGLFCVVGANIRYEGELTNLYVFSFWFNRLLMGFVFGLMTIKRPLLITIVRGAVFGLIISFAFYSSTEFLDLTGFFAGGIYGVIIELTAYKLDKTKK